MKRSNLLFPLLTLVSALACFPAAARAQLGQSILITVDDTDPAAVTFTATTNPSLASDSSHNTSDGVDLTVFFTAEEDDLDTSVTTAGLTTFVDVASSPFDTAAPDSLSGSLVDLNFFTNGDTASPMTFTEGTQAFLGQIVVDLSAAGSALPAAGYIGNIYSGYNNVGIGPPPEELQTVDAITNQVLIGQYIVVPEPGPGILMLVGGGALAALGWRGRRSGVFRA